MTVISREDEAGVFPSVLSVEFVDKQSEMMVGHHQCCSIAVANVEFIFFVVSIAANGIIAGPIVELRIFSLISSFFEPMLGAIERFVGVEDFEVDNL